MKRLLQLYEDCELNMIYVSHLNEVRLELIQLLFNEL